MKIDSGSPRRTVKSIRTRRSRQRQGQLRRCSCGGAGAIGIAMNAATGAFTATVLVSVSLFVGRRGIRGVMEGLWSGFGDEEEDG
jgi:hypothetical protein